MAAQQRTSKFVSRVAEQLPSVQAALAGWIRRRSDQIVMSARQRDHTTARASTACWHSQSSTCQPNNITTLHGFQPLPDLRVLNLASNRLQELSGLPPLPALTRLSCAHNSISSLRGLSVLETASSPLETLDLRNNRIDQLTELAVLAPINSLRKLQLSGGSHPNGIANIASLGAAVVTALPQVRAARYKLRPRFSLTHVRAVTLYGSPCTQRE